MSTELAKTFDPTTTQEQALKLWHDHNAFHAEPTDPGRPYAIVIPPPNVTAALHLGHALNNTLQDILTRYHRMLGDNTCWLPGTDHAGIATQTVVEKRVLKEEGKKRTEFTRDEFVAKIQTWKDEYERRITEQLKAMGCSCDWQRQAFTMDPPRAKAVREAFFRLFKDGLIYRGKRLVNWDPATQTALADDEVEMEEIDGHFYYLQYPFDDGTGHVTVATTRPETMLGDTAVAINPKDPRAAALRGKQVRLPIVNRIIPIIEDDYVVLPDPNSDDAKAKYATGFLKVTPAHDPNDYEIGRRHNLPVINVLAPDGSISDRHGWSDKGDADFVLGLDRYEARRAIVEWFRQNKLLEEVKPYRHSVGHSYRSHVPIEPYLSDQWYVKVKDDRLAGAALRALAKQDDGEAPSELSRITGVPPVPATSEFEEPSTPQRKTHGRDARDTGNWQGQLKFFPPRYAKTFQSWHENIRDWCISRQLWWGHRIPVWHRRIDTASSDAFDFFSNEIDEALEGNHASCFGIAVDTETKAAIPTRELYPFDKIKDGYRLRNVGTIDVFICDITDDGRKWKSAGFTQDPDVLDTWFSSGLWPLSTLGWPDHTPELQTWNPTTDLVTAREIITLWVSRMVMFNLYFENRLPFANVIVHAMIQDGEGRKMSKSLGNGVDPLDIISSHGADALRFTIATMATNTQDVRMPVVHDPATNKNTSPKFDIGRNFCNKLWNAARFAFSQLEDGLAASAAGSSVDESKWSLADRWIVSRFNRAVESANAALADYRFDQYAKACYDFFWGDFCDWYVEAIKPALRDPARKEQTAHVLAALLDGALRLMHPMIPFITEVLYQRLNEIRPLRGLPGRLTCSDNSPLLIKATWPTVGSFAEAAEHIFPKLQEIISAIRNLRNELKVQPKQKVDVSILAPAEPARQLTENRELIESLATVTLKEVRADLTPPPGAARALAAGVEIFINLGQPAGDTGLAEKRCGELKKLTETLRGRLSNEAYTKKAPPHLVQQTKDQLADAEAEMTKLGCK
ncbi:MAG: valS [Phycisphaerales bacterium]|nr:valS [Phycisphaerales bacterium]